MDDQARTSPPSPSLVLPSDPPHVRLELFSQPRYLSGARDLVSAVARRFGFDESACGQIALAVDEALCNIIRHGYDRRTDGRIWIMIWPLRDDPSSAGVDPADPLRAGRPNERDPNATVTTIDAAPGGILIVIDDEARQVDLSTIRSRDLEDIRPGGLGVFIIQSVMDAVSYQHREGGGMRLMMAKSADPEALRRQRMEHPDIEMEHADEPAGGEHHP